MTILCQGCQQDEELIPPTMLCAKCTAMLTARATRMTTDEKTEAAHKHVLGIVAELRRKHRELGHYLVPLATYPSKSDYDYFRNLSSDSLMIRCEYEDFMEIRNGVITALRTVFGYECAEMVISKKGLAEYVEQLKGDQ